MGSISRSWAIQALVLALTLSPLGHAGDLDPPEAPSPTMLALDEVEARTPIQSLPGSGTATHVISQPGSYYLTGNITGESGKNGIEIQASDVTLDLNGFTLIGVPGSGTGIVATISAQDIHVSGGTVRGWENGGIDLSQAFNCIIRDIRFRDNSDPDQFGQALVVGPSSLIERCVAEGNAVNRAIHAGSRSAVRDCVVTTTMSAGNGFFLENDCLVTDCVSSQNGGPGFNFLSGVRLENCGFGFTSGGSLNTVSRCSATDNQDGGVNLGDVNAVEHSFIARNSNGAGTAAGVFLGDLTANNHIDGNTILSNDIGLSIGNAPAGGGHIIIRNILGGNDTERTIGSNNAFGQFISVGEAGSFVNTDPTANLIY
jgi:hypothetical protein